MIILYTLEYLFLQFLIYNSQLTIGAKRLMGFAELHCLLVGFAELHCVSFLNWSSQSERFHSAFCIGVPNGNDSIGALATLILHSAFIILHWSFQRKRLHWSEATLILHSVFIILHWSFQRKRLHWSVSDYPFFKK